MQPDHHPAWCRLQVRGLVRRRILTAILSVTVAAVVLFAIPLAVVLRQLVDEDAALRVERQAVLAARQVPADFVSGDDPVELPETTDRVLLGLYGPDGVLIIGTGPRTVEPDLRRALSNQVVDTELPGRRVVAVPVAADEQVVGLIRAEQSTDASESRSLRLLGFLAGVAAVVLLLGAATGSVLASRLARPVRRLRDATVELGRGNFSVDIPRSRIPEIDETTDALISTGRTLEDLISRERAFSADASHQLRTPVAGMRAAVETELQFPRGEPSLVLREVLEDLDRLEATITELLSFARTPHTADSTLDISSTLEVARSIWSPRLVADGRAIHLDLPTVLPAVWANESMLRHILDVLLDNAWRHGAGDITLAATTGGPHVTVSVLDEGPGIATLGASGVAGPRGPVAAQDPTHGHGLPLAQRYVTAMQGRLVINRIGPPSRVDVVLRRAAGKTEAEESSSYPPLA